MSAGGGVLLLETDRWRLLRVRRGELTERIVEVPDGGPLCAEGIARMVEAIGGSGLRGGLCLGLSPRWCFPGLIDIDGLPRKQAHTAMLYRLEETVPFEAERIAADFLPALGRRSLGVAVQAEPMAAAVEALEAAGVEIERICPAAFLVLAALPGEALTGRRLLLIGHRRREALDLTDGVPTAWYAEDDWEPLRPILQAHLLETPGEGPADPPTVCVGEAPPASFVSALGLADPEQLSDGPDALIVTGASALRAGSAPLAFNLRTGRLAPARLGRALRGPLAAAAVLAVLLFATLAGATIYRGMAQRALIRRTREDQRALFHELFPGQAAPVNVASRMESEARKLAGTSGAGGRLPRRPSALEQLRLAMAALPAELRLRINSIRLAPESLLIEGQSRSHGDAEAIAAALRRSGFAVEPPRTQRLAGGGVSFTLLGRPAGGEDGS